MSSCGWSFRSIFFCTVSQSGSPLTWQRVPLWEDNHPWPRESPVRLPLPNSGQSPGKDHSSPGSDRRVLDCVWSSGYPGSWHSFPGWKEGLESTKETTLDHSLFSVHTFINGREVYELSELLLSLMLFLIVHNRGKKRGKKLYIQKIFQVSTLFRHSSSASEISLPSFSKLYTLFTHSLVA